MQLTIKPDIKEWWSRKGKGDKHGQQDKNWMLHVYGRRIAEIESIVLIV